MDIQTQLVEDMKAAKKAGEASIVAKEAAELKAMFQKSGVVDKTISTRKSGS